MVHIPAGCSPSAKEVAMNRAHPRTRLLAILALSACLTGLTGLALAAGPPIDIMRSQANTVRAAVKKNIDLVIRPKLVVARGATGPVSTLGLSPDEKFLVTAVGDNSLRLWDLGVGREAAALTGHGAKVTALAVGPDGARAASADATGQVRLWDLKNPQESVVLPLNLPGVTRLAFAGPNRLVLASSSGQAVVWDLAANREAARVEAHSGGVLGLAVAPDGSFFVTSGADGAVKRFDAATGKPGQEFKAPGREVLCLAVNPGLGLLAGGGAKGEAFLWTLADGKLARKIEAHDGPVTGISLNEDAGLLATGGPSGGAKGEIKVFDARSGAAVKTLGRHEGAVNFVQVDREGTHVLSASEDGTTRLWNIRGGTLLVTMISTVNGWAIVDAQGRFDGSQAALSGIEWQDGNTKLPVSNFSELYYEPTLLPKARGQALAGVKSIPEGIHLPPKVEIEPGQEGGSGVVKIRVRGEDQGGSGVEEVRLYQNGKLVPEGTAAKPEVVKDDSGVVEMVRRYDLPLAPGDNLLAAVAVNKERLESPPSTVVVKGGQQAAPPALHLLTVGINKYRNAKLNLDYAEVDARSIKDFFTAQGKSFPFAKAEVTHLADQQATKQGIQALFAQVRKVPAQDLVVLYLAGHGVGLGDEWYFVPHDVDNPDTDQIRSQGLSSRELKQEMEAIPANRVFVVIDACHSGGAVSPLKDFQGMKALRMLARDSGVHVLSATDKNQFAVELSQLGHGVFTYSLLKGLSGEADTGKDGTVSVGEAMAFVERMVPILSQRFAKYLQYPTAHSRGFDFTLVNTR
jgi:hypothetical protein